MLAGSTDCFPFATPQTCLTIEPGIAPITVKAIKASVIPLAEPVAV